MQKCNKHNSCMNTNTRIGNMWPEEPHWWRKDSGCWQPTTTLNGFHHLYIWWHLWWCLKYTESHTGVFHEIIGKSISNKNTGPTSSDTESTSSTRSHDTPVFSILLSVMLQKTISILFKLHLCSFSVMASLAMFIWD